MVPVWVEGGTVRYDVLHRDGCRADKAMLVAGGDSLDVLSSSDEDNGVVVDNVPVQIKLSSAFERSPVLAGCLGWHFEPGVCSGVADGLASAQRLDVKFIRSFAMAESDRIRSSLVWFETPLVEALRHQERIVWALTKREATRLQPSGLAALFHHILYESPNKFWDLQPLK